MRLSAYPLAERGRLRLLKSLAALGPEPFVAVIGLGAPEIHALVEGVRAASARKRYSPQNPRARLHVFCWHDIERGHLRGKLAYHDGAKAKPRLRKRKQRRFTIFEVTKFHTARDGTRDTWEKVVGWQVEEGAPRYSLVVHLGSGTADDIDGDLDVLVPQMDDGTKVVLCGLAKGGPERQLRRMLRQGWHVVPHGDVAELSRPPCSVVEEVA